LCLLDFDGPQRWVSFWFCFGARLSRELFFDTIPGLAHLIHGSARLIPD
jgi:hypothetical protein